jgi:hypothetical protein
VSRVRVSLSAAAVQRIAKRVVGGESGRGRYRRVQIDSQTESSAIYTRLPKYQNGDLSAERISGELGDPYGEETDRNVQEGEKRKVEAMPVWKPCSLATRSKERWGGER